jgi:hypothetical protein
MPQRYIYGIKGDLMEHEQLRSWVNFQTFLNAAFIVVIIFLLTRVENNKEVFDRNNELRWNQYDYFIKDSRIFEDRVTELEKLAGIDVYEPGRFVKYE